MAINRIKDKNVSDAVLDEIKRLIGSGEWKEGSKIPPENELAAMMGSQESLSEARCKNCPAWE